MQKIAGKYNGPWDHIILRDVNHPENEYKVFVKDEHLTTDGYEAPIEGEDGETDTAEGRLAIVSANVVQMRQDTEQMESNAQEIDAQISTLETDVSALGTRIQAVGTSISSLESSMRVVAASVSAMGTSVTSLESRVAVLERDGQDDNVYVPATTFNNQMDAIRGSISGLNSRATSLETQVNTLNSDVSSLKTFKNTVQSDISDLKTRVQALESSGGQQGSGASDTSDIDDELESLSGRIAVLEQRTSILGDLANYSISILTREQYNQIQEKDSQTLYFIVGE